MKAISIKYNPITGAQMIQEDIFPTDIQRNVQEQKARRAADKAKKYKSEIIAKHTHNIQHKQK